MHLFLKWRFSTQQLTSPWSRQRQKRHGWAAVILPSSLSSCPQLIWRRIQDSSSASLWQLCSALWCTASESGKLKCSHIRTTPADHCERPVTIAAQQPTATHSCRAFVRDHKTRGQLQSLLPKGKQCQLNHYLVFASRKTCYCHVVFLLFSSWTTHNRAIQVPIATIPPAEPTTNH